MKRSFKTKWENHWKQATARTLAAALTITTCLQGGVFPAYAESYGKNGVIRENMTSQQIVEDMGLGYNIGNTFDSIGSWITIDDPWEYQRAWNNDPVSKHFIQKVHQAGFKSIRLPVSWAKWIDGNNQIDPGYMSAVQTVVDWCMEEDMYVILNIHHDSGAADNSWVRNIVTDFDGISQKYAAVWTQIANNFAGYGDHLIFEGMNEVEFPAASNKSRQYELLNHLNQLFVDTVRSTGGNNARRHLLIPGFNTDIKQTCDRRYQMPNDPAGHCILSIHYYSPSPFAVAEHNVDWCEPVTTWGSEEDIKAVRDHFDTLASHFLSKGVPVIIGEYGVLTEDNKEKDSIHAYVKRIPELVMEYGMCPVLWDTSNAGDMKFIERNSGEFYDQQIRANYAELAQKKASGQIARKDFSVLNYKEVSVPISPGGWVSLDSFDAAKILGIKFRLQCSSDWDSYGGGGIWIDGYGNTPQYQFNSVFDEVTYMFTEEERTRLGDILGVLLWWTDESKGGNRVKELSFEGGRVTLLYADGENVNGAGPYTSTGAPSGGGGGGGGGGGTSSRPNNSTEPGQTGNQYGDKDIKDYPYSINGTVNADGDPGITMKITDICPDFELGDTIRLSFYPLCDSWSSGALDIPGLDDNGFGSNPKEWTFMPLQNSMTAKLWVTGGHSYFRFNMKAEVVQKGNAEEQIVVKNGEQKTFTWQELMALTGGEGEQDKNKILTVRFAVQSLDNESLDGINITMYKANGVSFSTDLSSEDGMAGGSISGAPRRNGSAVIFANNGGKDVCIKKVIVEVQSEEDDAEVLQKMQNGITNFDKTTITSVPYDGSMPAGVKIYFTIGDAAFDPNAFGGRLFVNDMGWDDGLEAKDWQVQSDKEGAYIFVPQEKYGSTVSRVWFNLWGMQDGFSVTKIAEIVKAEENPFEPVEVIGEQEIGLDQALEKSDAGTGDMVRTAVTVQTEGKFSGEIIFEDKDGNILTGVVSADGAGEKTVKLVGRIGENPSVTVKADGDSETQTCTIANVQISKLVDDGSLIHIESSPVRAEIAASTVEKAGQEPETVPEDGKAGIKVYYEYDGDIKDGSQLSANLIVNGDWSYGNESWELGEDSARSSNGKYIFYPSENKINSVTLAVWYMSGKPLKITGLTVVQKESPVIPDDPGEDAQYEIAVEPDAEGKYQVPADNDRELIGIRFTGKTLSGGMHLKYRQQGNDWDTTKWLNSFTDAKQETLFDDGFATAEYFAFDGSQVTDISDFVLLYWDVYEGTISSEDPLAAGLPADKAPVYMRYQLENTEEGNYGLGCSLTAANTNDSTAIDYWVACRSGGMIDYDLSSKKDVVSGIIQSALGDGEAPRIRFNADQIADKNFTDPALAKIIFYYNESVEPLDSLSEKAVALAADLDESAVFNMEEAIWLAKNLFRLPVINTPIGMWYTTAMGIGDKKDEGSVATLKVSDSAEDLQEKAVLASASNASRAEKATGSNWKTVADKLPVKPGSEKYHEFTPAEQNAIGSLIKWADEHDSDEFPVLYFDLGKLGYWVDKLILVFEEGEILDDDGFDNGDD